MNTKYEITVGLGFDKNGNKLDPNRNEIVLNSALNETAKLFGGYSVTKNKGGYIMSSTGEFVQEDSITVSIVAFFEDHNEINKLAADFKARFNQESVLVVMIPVTSRFV